MRNELKEMLEIIENNEESDFECYGVGYEASYQDGKIIFKRIVTIPTDEYYSDGGIDTKSVGSILFEKTSDAEDYANIVISYFNYKYEIEREGCKVEYINFRLIR